MACMACNLANSWHMCFPKNFADVSRTPILQNADRLQLPKYLLKFKIAALDKFSEAAVCRNLSKQVFFCNIYWKTSVLESLFNKVAGLQLQNCKVCLNSFFYRTPLVVASEKYEYTIYMLDLLQDCYNCFSLSLIEKHLNEPIIYYNFSFLVEKSF